MLLGHIASLAGLIPSKNPWWPVCIATFHHLLLSGSRAHSATVLGLGVWNSGTCRISDVLTSKWGFLAAQPSWLVGAQSSRLLN